MPMKIDRNPDGGYRVQQWMRRPARRVVHLRGKLPAPHARGSHGRPGRARSPQRYANNSAGQRASGARTPGDIGRSTMMSTSRRLAQAPYDQQRVLMWPIKICRWCGNALTGRRTSWCSDACANEYMIRADANHVRQLVFQRDRGVCAVCGVDAESLRMRASRAMKRGRRGPRVQTRYGFGMYAKVVKIISLLKAAGWPDDVARSWWEADHILPVVEGGGECGLENYRTLCVPCHKAETAALAARRALARREQIQPSLE